MPENEAMKAHQFFTAFRTKLCSGFRFAVAARALPLVADSPL